MITIPNIITFFRIILTPLFIYLFVKGNSMQAMLVFLVAVISDKIDGFIARKYNQESEFGKKFDAFADSFLIFSSIITLFFLNYISILILILLIMPRIISFILLRWKHKDRFFTSMNAKIAAIFSYTLIILLVLKINILVVYLWMFAVWFFTALHWVHIQMQKA